MKISGCKHVISYRNQNLNSAKFLGTKLTKIKIWPVLYQIPYVRMHMLYVPELCWWRKVVAVCKGYLGDGQGRWHWPHEGRKRPLQLHWAHPRHIHFHLEWIHHQPEKSERTIYLSLKKKIAIASTVFLNLLRTFVLVFLTRNSFHSCTCILLNVTYFVYCIYICLPLS